MSIYLFFFDELLIWQYYFWIDFYNIPLFLSEVKDRSIILQRTSLSVNKPIFQT